MVAMAGWGLAAQRSDQPSRAPLWALFILGAGVLVAPAAMPARVTVPLATAVVRLFAAPQLVRAMWRRPTAATSPPKQRQVPMHRNLPLSAYAKLPRQLLRQLTVKENKHAATRSPQIPQRAEGP